MTDAFIAAHVAAYVAAMPRAEKTKLATIFVNAQQAALVSIFDKPDDANPDDLDAPAKAFVAGPRVSNKTV